jgi:hypothetical protein
MNSFIPQNPTVNVLLNPEGKVEAIANNIAPLNELVVTTTTDRAVFDKQAGNKPFDSRRPVAVEKPHTSKH